MKKGSGRPTDLRLRAYWALSGYMPEDLSEPLVGYWLGIPGIYWGLHHVQRGKSTTGR